MPTWASNRCAARLQLSIFTESRVRLTIPQRLTNLDRGYGNDSNPINSTLLFFHDVKLVSERNFPTDKNGEISTTSEIMQTITKGSPGKLERVKAAPFNIPRRLPAEPTRNDSDDDNEMKEQPSSSNLPLRRLPQLQITMSNKEQKSDNDANDKPKHTVRFLRPQEGESQADNVRPSSNNDQEEETPAQSQETETTEPLSDDDYYDLDSDIFDENGLVLERLEPKRRTSNAAQSQEPTERSNDPQPTGSPTQEPLERSNDPQPTASSTDSPAGALSDMPASIKDMSPAELMSFIQACMTTGTPTHTTSSGLKIVKANKEKK